jgi:hypothetical protein
MPVGTVVLAESKTWHIPWNSRNNEDQMPMESDTPDQPPDMVGKTDQPTPGQEQLRETFIALVFGGDTGRYDEFCALVAQVLPPAASAVVRGSAITGERWKDKAPFDADGPGTSDIDLTLVGADLLEHFSVDGFWVPGIHSRPLSDVDPDIAPTLVPLRERLMAMVGRPVNIQASRDVVIAFRGDLLGQPYLTIIGKAEPAEA